MMYVSDYAYSASKERWADNISASKFPWMFVGEEWTMLSVSDGGKIYIDDGSSFLEQTLLMLLKYLDQYFI